MVCSLKKPAWLRASSSNAGVRGLARLPVSDRSCVGRVPKGAAMQQSLAVAITGELVLNALLMAVWRKKPRSTVTLHSDQGRQYTSHERQAFLKNNNLQASMTRRGNCHDNAVAESFFQ